MYDVPVLITIDPHNHTWMSVYQQGSPIGPATGDFDGCEDACRRQLYVKKNLKKKIKKKKIKKKKIFMSKTR